MADNTTDITMSVGLDLRDAENSLNKFNARFSGIMTSQQKKITKVFGEYAKVESSIADVEAKVRSANNELKNQNVIYENIYERLEAIYKSQGTKNITQMSAGSASEVQKLTSELNTVNAKIKSIVAHIKELETEESSLGEISLNSLEQLMELLNKLPPNQRAIFSDLIGQLQSAFDEFDGDAFNDKSADELANAYSNLKNYAIQLVRGGLIKLDNALTNLIKKFAQLTKQAFKFISSKISNAFKNLNKHTSKTASGLGNATSMLKKFILAGLGVRSIYFLFRKFWKMIGEGINIMAQVDAETNSALTSIKTASYSLQKQIGSMVSTIVQAVAPALTYLINLITRVITALSQLFGSIAGKSTYKKATTQVQDYAKSLDKSASSTKNADKENKKYLSGLDEIAQFDDKSNDSLGGAGALAGAFEDVPIEPWANNMANKLKDIFSKLFDPIKKAWDNVGQNVIDSWIYALNKVGSLLKSIGEDFLEVWQQDATVTIFENILEIVSDIGLVVGNLASNFQVAWEFADTGKHIFETIRDLIGIIVNYIKMAADATVVWSAQLNFNPILQSTLSFLQSLKPVIDSIYGVMYDFYTMVILPLGKWVLEGGLPSLLDVFKQFNESVDWEGLRQNIDKIWQALEPFAETIGEGLIMFIDSLSQKFAEFLNSEEFSQWCADLSEWMNSITAEDINGFLQSIFDILSGIGTVLGTIVSLVIDNKDIIFDLFTKFADFMGSLTKGNVTKAISDIATAFVSVKLAIFGINSAIAGFKLASIIAPISQAISVFVTKLGGLGLMIAGGITAITNFFAMLKTGFSWVKEILMVIGIALAAVGAVIVGIPATIAAIVAAVIAVILTGIVVIKDNWNTICDFFKNTGKALAKFFTDLWDGIKNVKIAVWNAIKTFLTKLWNSIISVAKTIFTTLKTTVVNIWNVIKTSLFNIITNIKTNFVNTFTSIKTAVTNIFNGLWSNIKGVINLILGGVEKMANGVITGINDAIRAMNNLQFDVPGWVPLVGGNHLGFNLGTLSNISIPKLAQGAVIPANSPFLAMLGDQKSGTNVEAPLETIKQAVAEVMGNNNANGGSYEFIAQINRKTIFEEMISEARLRRTATGRNPFEFI